jgi:hypothetical protein
VYHHDLSRRCALLRFVGFADRCFTTLPVTGVNLGTGTLTVTGD